MSGAAPEPCTPPALAAQVMRLRLADALLISDLHLADGEPATLDRFLRFCAQEAAAHAELLILGDLFEYWAGDDDRSATADAVTDALRRLDDRGVAVYLMHGNRDLLLGEAFVRACGATLLADPTVADIGATAALLAHGDAYCIDDLDYRRFRVQARDPQWQSRFLAQPLAQRHEFIGRVRAASEAGKKTKSMQIMDVAPAAIDAALREAGVRAMIHGHTHRPAVHRWLLDGEPAQRWVLADWAFDVAAAERRGGYLAVSATQWRVGNLPNR